MDFPLLLPFSGICLGVSSDHQIRLSVLAPTVRWLSSGWTLPLTFGASAAQSGLAGSSFSPRSAFRCSCTRAPQGLTWFVHAYSHVWSLKSLQVFSLFPSPRPLSLRHCFSPSDEEAQLVLVTILLLSAMFIFLRAQFSALG